MMRSGWKPWRNAAYLALLIVAMVLIVIAWPHLMRIWREQALTFMIAVLLMVLATLIQARNFVAFLDGPHKLHVRMLVPVWALGALANYVAPLQPGVAVRVAYLSRCGITVTSSLLATWRQISVSVWIALAGLAIGLAASGDPRGRWPALLLAVTWLSVMALRRLWLSWLDRLHGPEWLVQRKHLLHRAVTGIRGNGIIGVIVQYVIGTLLIYWVYRRFGARIDPSEALTMACLVYASSLLAVLPGNLGMLEAIYMIGGHGFGLTITEAAALAVLIRVAHVASNFLLVVLRLPFRDKDSTPDAS